jgi:flagellar FliJ protein
MKAAASLIRLSNYQVEVLQKRLAEIVERREHATITLAMLEAEGEAETLRAGDDAVAGWYLVGYRQGLKIRMEAAQFRIDEALAEEVGARDALSAAFEDLKKYEQVAANAKTAARAVEARRETAALDELGLRRSARR